MSTTILHNESVKFNRQIYNIFDLLGDLGGVTEVIIAFRNPYSAEPDTQSVEEKIGMINWYADNVIKPYRS